MLTRPPAPVERLALLSFGSESLWRTWRRSTTATSIACCFSSLRDPACRHEPLTGRGDCLSGRGCSAGGDEAGTASAAGERWPSLPVSRLLHPDSAQGPAQASEVSPCCCCHCPLSAGRLASKNHQVLPPALPTFLFLCWCREHIAVTIKCVSPVT